MRMSGEPRALEELEALLDHRFRDRSLLETALTHPSLDEEEHYERLEFLGDAVLDAVVSDLLYRGHGAEREGALTELRSLLVSRRTLAEVGQRLGLGAWLRYGGNLAGRGSLPKSVLGNVVEALLAAVYLDLGPGPGIEKCMALAQDWLGPELAQIDDDHERAHAKQLLQQWAQAEVGALPRYRLGEVHEHPESSSFQVHVELGGRDYPAAWGRSKREAEKRAAWEAVLVLRAEGRLAG